MENVYRHCPICAAKRHSMREVQNHMFRAHGLEKLFECGKMFSQQSRVGYVNDETLYYPYDDVTRK